MSILLMTATINSGYFLNVGTTIKDTEIRKSQYCDALTKYICNSRFDKIVFAENSGDSLDEEYFVNLARKHNKELEFLTLLGDKKRMIRQGKSYGEARLISDAVENSQLMRDETSFYKVTGRVWIENINRLINNKDENRFIAHNFKSWVLTSFFKVRKDDYIESFLDAYEKCNDNTIKHEMCVEHIYFECLKNVQHKVKNFIPYPDLRGINSGSGAPYTKSTKKLFVRNVASLLKINEFDYNYHFYYKWFFVLEKMIHRH